MTVLDSTLRVTTFLLHFASAIFLLGVAFQCGEPFVSNSYLQSITNRLGFVVLTDEPCTDPHTRDCFFGMPQAYDVLQRGFEWNPVALLAAFEWLSASFALFYLKDALWADSQGFRCAVDTGCLLWNVAGFFLFMPFSLQITLLQSGLTALALLATLAVQIVGEAQAGLELDASREEDLLEWDELVSESSSGLNSGSYSGSYSSLNPRQQRRYFYGSDDASVGGEGVVTNGSSAARPTRRARYGNGAQQWNIPKAPNDPTPQQQQQQATLSEGLSGGSSVRVVQHLSEYCASASLLLVAVLILFVVDPLSWASIVAFTGILLCNLAGIAAHYCKLDQHTKPSTPWYDLDWTKEGNHFKLFMLHSWSVLLLSIFIIIYLGWVDLTNDSVPTLVRFILWNLLVTYSLFGFWATLCYSFAGTRVDPVRFGLWMGRLDYGLTVLSVAAKLPVAFTVYYGLVAEPGGVGCK